MKIVSSILSVSVFALFLMGSCKKTDAPVDYTEIDQKIIQDYIAANGLDADSTASGLYYVIDKPGNGKTPNQYSDVSIRYKGYLVSGEVFDEKKTAITLNLSRVIAGWTEGLQYYKEGGTGTLLIPSRLGYGSQKSGPIPANSVLLFDIKLDEVR